MLATMHILGWKAEGLRCPDHEINLCDADGKPHKISLIQMPNGTGKTTTLNLLRAALSGSAPGQVSWTREAIKELGKKNGGSYGKFEVRLLLNQKRVTIILEFNFQSGNVQYKTTSGSGQENQFNPPADFRRFMNANFVNFYVFDGELAAHLLDRKHTNAEAVVEHLFQISTLKTMSDKVAEYYQEQTRNVSASEQKGYVRRKNRVNSLTQHLKDLRNAERRLKDQKRELTEQRDQQITLHQQAIEKEKTRAALLSEADKRVGELQAIVRQNAISVLDQMTFPQALSTRFAEDLQALKLGLDKVKLPESAAREFFEELADEAECICGRHIDEDIRNVIRSRAKHYLGSDNVAMLNSMKTAIQEAVGTSTSEAEEELSRRLSELTDSVHEEREARNEHDEILLEASETDPAVREAQKRIEELNMKIRDIEKELEKYQSSEDSLDDEHTYGIKVVEHRLKDAENKYAEITKTIELKEKRDILQKLFNAAHQHARAALTTDLCHQANTRIQELMPHNDIKIEKIDKCLILQGQEGGSAGEQLSIAYAFLATLFNRTEHQLPFIVDSPAGPIDLGIRPKIGNLIPKLTDQFIAFTISSERQGFTAPLKQASSAPIHYVTLFRQGATDMDSQAQQDPNCTKTADGYHVLGEAFFNTFQLDEEME